MDLLAVLLEGFDYDAWANKIWLEAAHRMPSPARPLEVLTHMAWAHGIWLSRVGDTRFLADSTLSENAFEERCRAWKDVLRGQELDRVIVYENTSGVPFKRSLLAIVRHVVDHGTYHRGQLRGFAEAQGFGDFPETGLNGFYDVRGLFR